MDFGLSEEQRLVQKAARDFAAAEVAPLAKKIDAEHYFPEELLPKLAALGFLGMNAPEKLGGAELDSVSYCLITEEIARHCASTSVILAAHNSLCIAPILNFGTEEQKKKYIPKLASGEYLGCFALSEPGTGSDAARQTCMSKPEGDSWRINGMKNWITNGPVADICILFTMEKPDKRYRGINCFIVELKNDHGVSVGKKEDKLGICGSPTASLSFEDTVLPQDRMLSKPGDGFKVAMNTLDGGRLGIAAQAVGIGRAALEDSLAYAKDRKAFGRAIAEHQSIQNYLADMSCRLDAARLMTWHGARMKDSGQDFTRQAAQAKLYASEAAVFCSHRGIQIHGGYGYVREFNAERYYRDARITEIYEGTSEIQRLVIAGQLLKE